MSDRELLTPKQLKVLKFIEDELSRYGKMPTFRAIADYLGVKAVGTVQDYIRKLLDLGFLEKEGGKYSGFKLPHQTRVTLIPILGSVPAGRPIEAIESFQGSVALSGNWRGDLFALRVKGQSMRDRGILDGDYVIVKKQPDAEDGQIVVAAVNHEATVKLLERKKGKVRLLPANPDFAPIELSSENENSIIGRVVAVQRMY
jgi:repressor LexA